jgi:hypothetical protein
MRKTVALAIYLFAFLFTGECKASNSVLPDHIVLDQRLDYLQYESYLIPCINWLQQTPLSADMKERRRVDNFIMYWLQKNTEVAVTIPDYLVKFQNINSEFYFLYNGGWIKHALENKDDSKRVNYFLAGMRSMLNYYDADMGVKKNDYMDYLVALDKQGKLETLYDTTNYEANTLLYLKTMEKRKSFKSDENYFNFHFTVINFIDPKAVACRYKLEGYYDEWVPAGDENIIFPKLPPGDYQFRIQASMFPDFSHAAEQNYSFSIKAPFWKQPWFIIAAIMGAFGIYYTYTRQREKNLKEMAMLQQEKMIFEYDHLRSQVNPHFLFNSLNTLTSLIEEEPTTALEYSTHLSDLYRNILAYRSEDLVYLYEELEILNNYIHIQKCRFGDALHVQIQVSEEIKQNKKVVPLALQLLVENAMKHNIVSTSQPLIVTVKAEENKLIVSNNIQLKMSKEKGLGLGLENISKRYALATDRKISYGAVRDEYVVQLPLL